MSVNCRLRVKVAFVAAALGWIVVQNAAPASANVITFELDTLFGGMAPVGHTPWVTASFRDVGRNTVRFTLSAVGLRGSEFLGRNGFLFNLDPFPHHLRAKWIGGQKGRFSFKRDRFKPGGKGPFDALLGFSKGHRLRSGQRSVWNITGKGLSTTEILALGFGESQGLDVASLVQGIPGSKHKGWRRGWITEEDSFVVSGPLPPKTDPGDLPPAVPLPPALWLFGSGLGYLVFLSRRQRATKQAAAI